MPFIEDRLIDAAQEVVKFVEDTVDKNLPTEIADIVKTHSAGAAVAGVASGWVPGAGGAAATAAAIGFIWGMYARINGKLGVKLSENVVKTLASGVATNLAAYAVAGIVMTTAFSLMPGLGSIPASILAGATTYALTLLSGLVYLKVLTKLFRAGVDPSTASVIDLKNVASEVINEEDIKSAMKEAKTAYKRAKENGELDIAPQVPEAGAEAKPDKSS